MECAAPLVPLLLLLLAGGRILALLVGLQAVANWSWISFWGSAQESTMTHTRRDHQLSGSMHTQRADKSHPMNP